MPSLDKNIPCAKSHELRALVGFWVRRAKLGFVYGVQVPILETLARYQVLSVALALVTRSAKRTQGGDGPQCESVKGLSPVIDMKLWMPTCSKTRKAIPKEPIAKALAGPPGSKTVARH